MSEDSLSVIDNYTENLTVELVNVDNTYTNYIKEVKTTRPYITKFEIAKIIGTRAEQLASGAVANIKVPAYITDVRKIAEMEFYQKKIPFIVRRKLPNGLFEHFRLSDFKNI